ncbi:Ig-like domain-containing protein [Lysinibacillus sp. FSL K6-0057]|uniref:beta strand repeat-containing protein n=1 Tax=Lysinibacillus sp. FSL K6-0057 TaxID=2921411 RepID=UPI003159A8DE
MIVRDVVFIGFVDCRNSGSISAINAKEIKVVFNQKVTAATAEWAVATAAGTITVKPTGGAAISVTSKLAADGLSATLTLDGVAVLANSTGYDVTVGTGVLNEKGEGLKQASTATFQFNDKVKPTVTSVQSVNGDVVVNFSEKLAATATTVVVNGQSHSVTPTAGATKVTVPKANFTGAAALEAGKNYTVVVAGATDYATNAMDLYSGSVTYAVVTDTVAPTVSSVTVNNEKTFTVVFSEEIKLATPNTPIASDLGLTLTTGAGVLAGGAPTVTSTDNKTFKVTLAATPFGANDTSKAVTATFTGFKDTALNLGTTTSQQVTFTKDTVAPKFVNAEYNANTNKIAFNFDETLLAASTVTLADVTIVNNANGQTVATAVASEAVAANSKSVVFDNDAVAGLNLANGSYTFHFATQAVTDASYAANKSAGFSTPVNITGSATVKPTLTSAVANATNEITVTYATTKVKGGNVAGSATDASNYKLNGKALPTGTVLTIDGANQVVKIQLPAGSIDASTTQILTISGVQALGATATIDTLNTTVTLTDTKAPVITGAAVNASGNLVLTFSENVVGAGAPAATTPVDGDFIVAINGAALAAGTDFEVDATASSKNQVVIKTKGTVSFATGTITVKSTGTTGADAAGNKISTVEVVTATR